MPLNLRLLADNYRESVGSGEETRAVTRAGYPLVAVITGEGQKLWFHPISLFSMGASFQNLLATLITNTLINDVASRWKCSSRPWIVPLNVTLVAVNAVFLCFENFFISPFFFLLCTSIENFIGTSFIKNCNIKNLFSFF